VRVQILDGGGAGAFVAARPHTSAEEKTMVAAAPSSGVSSQVLPGSVVDNRVKSAARAKAQPTPLEIGKEPVAVAESKTEPQVELRPVPASRNMYVQVGSFRERVNAERLRGRLLRAEPGFQISPITVEGKAFYRVRTGPLATVEIADATLARVIAAGQQGAQIVVD
ncbi:MAG: SPOR domain-containing protein, partial [Alphaproteobacteria bacterium]